MTHRVLVLLGLFVCFASATVLDLTAESFDEQVAWHGAPGGALVLFHAPWCGHCKKFMPTYEGASVALAEMCLVARVDASEERALGRRFNVTSFPQVRFIKENVVYTFKGSHTRESLRTIVEVRPFKISQPGCGGWV
jgi:protein disulfide-isomerase A5